MGRWSRGLASYEDTPITPFEEGPISTRDDFFSAGGIRERKRKSRGVWGERGGVY